jgi:hypothetical protein
MSHWLWILCERYTTGGMLDAITFNGRQTLPVFRYCGGSGDAILDDGKAVTAKVRQKTGYSTGSSMPMFVDVVPTAKHLRPE